MMKKLNILEAVRGGAALYVFIGHFVLMTFIDRTNKVSILFKFGQEAVILFFLMSGFVIQFSYAKKQIPFSEYFKKRFLRIYPLFLLSIFMVFIHNIFSGSPLELRTILGNLFMLQDVETIKPGTIVTTYGNSALWSLSYEWWFYMLFIPISNFKNKNLIVIFIVAISSILYYIYPVQLLRWLMYFGIWWSGVLLANFYLSNQLNLKNVFNKIIVQILFFPTLLLFSKTLNEPFVSIGIYPTLEIRHFVSAILFLLIAILWKHLNWLGYAFFKPLERIAPFSYGLYVLHLPIIMILEPFVFKYIKNSLIQFMTITLVVILLAYLFEVIIQKRLISSVNKIN
jgi:peptidoglycan/LPS O-acetylase OafA/YrhL